MKRYWRIIIIPAFIMITFGFLYIQHAIAKEDLPEFELVTVAGDEEMGEQLVIRGSYVDTEGIGESFRPSFRLTTDEFFYYKDLNILQQYTGEFNSSETMKRLISEERRFMRGKVDFPNLFFESEEQLAYVGPFHLSDQYQFEIDMLDKESRERKTFKIDVPDKQMIDSMYIEEVQIIEDMLYIVTFNYYQNMKELHLYKVALDEEEIVDHEKMIEVTDYSYLNVLNGEPDLQHQGYTIIEVEETEWNEGSAEPELVDSKYYAYYLETGDLHLIETPQSFMEQPNPEFEEGTFAFSGLTSVGKDAFYFIRFTEEAIEYYPYNLQSREFGETITLSLDKGVAEGIAGGVYMNGDYLYYYSTVIENENQLRKVFITDLENAEQIYEGEIRLKHTPKETVVYDLEVYQIELK